MNVEAIEKFGAMLAIVFAARVVVKFRTAKRQKLDLTTPLFDASLLEAALVPRSKDGDDANLLAELRDTFSHLNRRAYAEEFWNLHVQIVTLDRTLGPSQKSTLRRALLRLLLVNDRWLQLVAAKSCADLEITDAVRPLQALLEMGDSEKFSAEKTEYSRGKTGDSRYRGELENALARLTGG